MNRDALDAALLEAHDAGAAADIAALYAEAGHLSASSGNTDEACFFWTQGYIWALDAGLPLAAELKALLAAEGREQ